RPPGPAATRCFVNPCFRLGCTRHAWVHADLQAPLVLVLELHMSVRHGKQGVVAGAANVLPRMELGPALPHQDISRPHELAPIALDAQVLRVRIPAVAAGAYALLVSHL